MLEEARGRGFGLELVRFTVDEGALAPTKWILHTRDMHRLYAKLGFVAPGERMMERGAATPSALSPATERAHPADSLTAPTSAQPTAAPQSSRRAPRPQAVEQVLARPRDRDPLLRERVALADRDRVVLERLLVDRERERRADLVLAPVAPADLAAVVVLDRRSRRSSSYSARALLDHVVALADQRQDGRLHRGELRVEAQHGALALGHDLLVVGVDEEREHRRG